MEFLAKYSLADWVYGIGTSLIAAVLFAVFVFGLRWLWRWMRNFSAEYRRTDQRDRIIKIFVYRHYIKGANVLSLSRGHFFVISRCLGSFIAGVVIIAMGFILSWLMDMLATGPLLDAKLPLYLFVTLGVWLFIDAASWLDHRWSQKALDHLDEQALSEAAAILSETIDEVRHQVTQPNA